MKGWPRWCTIAGTVFFAGLAVGQRDWEAAGFLAVCAAGQCWALINRGRFWW